VNAIIVFFVSRRYRRLHRLVLFGIWIFVCVSGSAQQTNALQSEAQLSLTEAHKSRSDPTAAAGYYLDAADAALRSIGSQPESATNDSRLIYNHSCQELAVLLQCNQELWNRTGLAVSVTAIVNINRMGAKDDGVRDATLTLYEPSKRESIQLAGHGEHSMPTLRLRSSDGVVPYWSSHLEGAQSELIVPGSHGSYALPQTVVELKRILRSELAAREGASHTVTKSQRRRGNESGSKFQAQR
jgi:hypothetical protein